MKKIILCVLLVVMVVSGCKKSLDAKIPGTVNPTTFPKTEADFALLTTSIYKLFTSKWQYVDGGVTGNLFWGVEYSNIFLNDYPTDLIAYFPEWGGFFDGFSKADFNFMKTLGQGRNHLEKIRFITKITKIIDDIQKSNAVNDATKAQFVAQARVARGILMYQLLTMYGPVPYISDPALIGNKEAESNLTRPDRTTYVNQVASDLRYGADVLVKNPVLYGQFNKGCALTFLMRLYLNEKDWAKTEQAGAEIVALGYSLVANYASLFRAATEKNNETIWAISCDPAANGNDNLGNMNAWSYYTYPNDYPGNITQPGGKKLGGWAWPGAFTATWQFYDSFNPTDSRRTLLIDNYAAVNSSGNPAGYTMTRASGMRGPVIAKYPDDDPTAFAGNDIPVCRYADVLLMMAEAVNEQDGPTSEAQGFINLVRQRAGIGDLPAADIASKTAFRDAVLRERGWELYFEGQRRVDLMRHSKWTTTLASVNKKPQPGSALFPVPQYMLDLGLSQSDGY